MLTKHTKYTLETTNMNTQDILWNPIFSHLGSANPHTERINRLLNLLDVSLADPKCGSPVINRLRKEIEAERADSAAWEGREVYEREERQRKADAEELKDLRREVRELKESLAQKGDEIWAVRQKIPWWHRK